MNDMAVGAEGRRRRGRRAHGGADAAAPRSLTAASGGAFRPVSEDGLARILDAAFDILERVGMADPSAEAARLATDAGASFEGGRLTMPRDLVEQTVATAPREIVLCARRPEHDMTLSGGRIHVGTGGAAPMVRDLETGRYRPGRLRDLHDIARLVDRLDNVHFFSRSLVARDIETARDLDLNTAFACLCGTAKPVMVSASDPAHAEEIVAMCRIVAGSDEAFRARPFLSFNVNHAVPPLRFDPVACDVMIAAARAGAPVMVNTFGQLGASSPVTIAGSVAQTLAETLAGFVIARLAAPDARAVFGPRPMVTDLRTGAMSGGGGEQALLTAVSMQAARALGLPCSTIAGATDAKAVDAQAGYEKALSVTLAAQAGANLITQAAGAQASLMGVAFEAYVIDDEMLGAVLRSAVAVETDGDALSVDAIRDATLGEGHFLGRPETHRRMESDFLYPRLADRGPIAEWEAAGARDIADRARDRVRELLAAHEPDHLDPALHERLREQFGLRPETPWATDT